MLGVRVSVGVFLLESLLGIGFYCKGVDYLFGVGIDFVGWVDSWSRLV